MTHSGATQWRVECDTCGNQASEHLRMHSEVSNANVSYFPEEGRVGEDTTENDLKRLLKQCDSDEHLLVCNNCATIRVVT